MKMLLLVLAILAVVVLAFLFVEARLAHRRRLASPGVRDWRKLVEPLMRPTAILKVVDTPSTSYLGGQPPEFEGFAWPHRNGRPLAFLACIDLAQVSSGIDWFPKTGRLLFFYDLEKQPWGFDPQDRGAWVVQYDANSSSTAIDAPFPRQGGKADWEIPRRFISPEIVSLPPTWSNPGLDRLRLSEEELEHVEEWRTQLCAGPARHQMGGDPDPIQEPDMALQAQLVANGIYAGDGEYLADPRLEKIKAGAQDWELLLQIDSDERLNLMWNDAGRLYFWVKREEARQGNFANAWVILQCH